MKRYALSFLILAVISLPLTVSAQDRDTLWSETWEGNWTQNWYISSPPWEVGIPTNPTGPGSAFSGQNVAATGLTSNYWEPLDSRLVRYISFLVPPVTQNPRLRFWHWYDFASNDYGQVQLRTIGGIWQPISGNYTNTSSYVWTYACLDLSSYADSIVELAFYFHSAPINISSGWFIDNVSVITGNTVFNNPESWESGIGDWYVDYGTWQVGAPTSGPGSAYTGANCAATVLNGNYWEPVNSNLLSPSIIIPPVNSSPRLRLWNWYDFAANDYGQVKIKTAHGNWQTLSGQYTGNSFGWTYPAFDLVAYADSTVNLAFNFSSAIYMVSAGWYFDDIEIITGNYQFSNPEDWETGLGDWFVDFGTWEIGIPTGTGPANAHSGENCVGTNIDGLYGEPVNSKLISPPLTVPPLSEYPYLQYYHWYDFAYNDSGKVEIKPVGGTWTVISDHYFGTSNNEWISNVLILDQYADQTVQLAFHFTSYLYYNSSGWYIDDIYVNGFNPEPAILVAPNTINFGYCAVNSQVNQPLTIYNQGNANLILYGISTVNPPFTTNYNPADSVITPGDSLNLTVTFNPLQPVQYDEQLTILNNDSTVHVTLQGQGTGTDSVYVDLIPINPPIVVPIVGGDFDFNVIVGNRASTPRVFDLWMEIVLPQFGSVPTLSLDNITLPGQVLVTRLRTQIVPPFAPAGSYTYWAYVGDNPWVVSDTGQFQFTKAGALAGGSLGLPSDWLCSGEPFTIETAAASIPDNFALIGASPNPFNATTVIRYQMPDARYVSLRVYDTAGRLVSTLVNGYREAGANEVTFDGASLPSGVYLYRLEAGEYYAAGKMVLLK